VHRRFRCRGHSHRGEDVQENVEGAPRHCEARRCPPHRRRGASGNGVSLRPLPRGDDVRHLERHGLAVAVAVVRNVYIQRL
jgi:hypothetical protein